MSNEKLKFMDMLSVMRVIDDDDRVRKFEDCIERVFSDVSKKVAEYGRDGSLTIQIKFQCDKKTKMRSMSLQKLKRLFLKVVRQTHSIEIPEPAECILMILTN